MLDLTEETRPRMVLVNARQYYLNNIGSQIERDNQSSAQALSINLESEYPRDRHKRQDIPQYRSYKYWKAVISIWSESHPGKE